MLIPLRLELSNPAASCSWLAQPPPTRWMSRLHMQQLHHLQHKNTCANGCNTASRVQHLVPAEVVGEDLAPRLGVVPRADLALVDGLRQAVLHRPRRQVQPGIARRRESCDHIMDAQLMKDQTVYRNRAPSNT